MCRRLDGVPLGIESAAARVGALSPERILTGLADSFRLLSSTVRGAPSRQQTIAGCVQWSHDLLEPTEQVLLRRLAVFRGPFGIDAAEAITSGPDLHSDDVVAALAVLVDKSLVAFYGRGYGLLSPVREFARRRLLEAGEAEGVHDAHLAEFVRVAAQAAAELAAAPQIATLDALDAIRVDLTAAVDWALHRGMLDVAAALVTDLALFWQLRGRHGESVIRVRHVLAALPDDPSAVRAGLLWAAGQLGAAAMDLPGGYGIAETTAAVELAARHDYKLPLGRALGMQALVAALGAPAMAPDVARQARAAAAAAGDPFGVTMADVCAGFAMIWACARPDLAEEWMTGLHEAATDTGSPLWTAWRDLIVGIGHWRQGRLAEAIDALTAAESAAWALGEPVLESWCAAWAADAMLEAGRLEAAEEMLRRSAAWMDRSSWARLEWVLFRRATLALARGDLDGAQTALETVTPVLSATGFGFVSLELALIRGRIALYRGDLAAATAAEEETTRLTATVPMPWYLTRAANATGRLRRVQDRRIDAETAHHQALALCLAHGFALVAADTLDCLTRLAADAQSWTEAARLLGAADGLRARTGAVIHALDAAARNDVTAGITQALGPEAFEQARTAGYSLDLAEAIAYTARARGERKRPSAGWDSLTRTELMVVELAAQGLTNNQIADRLLIVPGTAKIHLHHIFAKLGITRRAELASRATERRLTAE
ncbi:MAG TPA: LuxR C-terminal-related transcriptional regulator [Sporichthyaceae bacterium]|nr:LuxR C-terminal-related transcriptional regulator [Sporichthyaceae bacterium]